MGCIQLLDLVVGPLDRKISIFGADPQAIRTEFYANLATGTGDTVEVNAGSGTHDRGSSFALSIAAYIQGVRQAFTQGGARPPARLDLLQCRKTGQFERFHAQLPHRQVHRSAIDGRETKRSHHVGPKKKKGYRDLVRGFELRDVDHGTCDGKNNAAKNSHRDAEKARVAQETRIGTVDIACAQLRAHVDRAKAQAGRPPSQRERLKSRIEHGGKGDAHASHQHGEGDGAPETRVSAFYLAHDIIAALRDRVDKRLPVEPDESPDCERKWRKKQQPHWQSAKEQGQSRGLKAAAQIA